MIPIDEIRHWAKELLKRGHTSEATVVSQCADEVQRLQDLMSEAHTFISKPVYTNIYGDAGLDYVKIDDPEPILEALKILSKRSKNESQESN